MRDWKDTLNLPRTDFPMKANLQATEPAAIRRWEETGLYAQIRQKSAGKPRFILHDGPPYANGQIHMGHVLNKVLKDFVVKARTMAGFDAPYVPGWDCHGLPIELNVDRELGPKKRQLSVADFRRACRDYAERFIEIQRQDFKRLGVLGDWSEPYLTMNYPYQAAIVRALGRFVERGLVYKGRKPVHWCIHCRTALAEAEVEYEQHSSPSIYVEFRLDDSSAEAFRALAPKVGARPVSVLIWTTTPWTIPSNLAIAFHPDFDYAAYDAGGTAVIVAEALADAVSKAINRPLGSPLATFKGRTLERLRFRHPLYARESLAVLGDYVTLEQGTGVVHTAPGHGSDDFHTGVQYGLEILAPVGPGGHFLDTVPLFGGLRVFDANPKIEEALASHGRLWHRETFAHAYPHCWRCHNPVIFLATSQWFIALDDAGGALRSSALAAADRVEWIPEWGADRMRATVGGRPDWCISRQRSWGVPIPAVSCTACGDAIITPALAEQAARVFERHGADAWYERPADEFLPEGLACPACGGTHFEREQDILDVWFDSGSSHLAVLDAQDGATRGLHWPADMYLEGTDQYRGWFQSSLLIGLGVKGREPYRQVLTHGFVVDEQDRKMSKSLGNFIAPQDVIEKSGAEVLRLWVSMVDYRDEVRFGDEVLTRVIEAYRKIRNTFRFLVSNLYDFDPTRDTVAPAAMQEIDRYALSRFAEAGLRMLHAYERYEFPTIFHTLNTLVTVELSAFYLDVSKDRLYTLGAKSAARRSAQTAIYRIAEGLTRLVAPILPVTADEIWRHVPGRREGSVHLASFPDRGDLDALAADSALAERWTRLIDVRDRVNVALEQARQQKVIGNSLAARVELEASGEEAALLERYRGDLPMLFIASQAELRKAAGAGPRPTSIRISRADGTKCPRCWRVVPALVPAGSGADGLCDRCAEALAETVV